MNITSVDSSNVTNILSEQEALDQGTLDSEEFLNVLVTQLQNQNPLEPMNDLEYITQMVQFSMLDGINNMSSVLYESKALDYIGKNVLGTFTQEDSSQQNLIAGLVQSVSYVGDKVLLNLDTGAIYLDNVLK